LRFSQAAADACDENTRARQLKATIGQLNSNLFRVASVQSVMIRAFLRFIGLVLLAAGFVFLLYDGTKSIADQRLFITKAGDVWNNVHSTSLQLAQAGIERHVADWLWQSGIQPILEQPAWLVFGVLGIAFMVIGRRKRPLIGYAR
jgi:hypothetical protein